MYVLGNTLNSKESNNDFTLKYLLKNFTRILKIFPCESLDRMIQQ